MANEDRITPEVRYYPVGNGDTTLIITPTGQEILVDCKIAENGEAFDIRADLIERLEIRNNRPYLPVFILTHGDEDHIIGFARTFHTGPPSEYEVSEDEDELLPILIGTLWFSPQILNDEELCEDAEAYRDEALRRLQLHKGNAPDKDKPGNRIVVIGYTSDETLQDIPDDIRFSAGDIIESIDHDEEPNFRIFVHAPFRKDLDNETVKRNDTSIALMAAFDVGATENASKFFFGGDANYAVLEEILRQSRLHNNESWLEYDVLQTPHHCSWSSFNDTPYSDNRDPSDKVLELLAHGREGAQIVASSKPIREDDDNPPHQAAKREYLSVAGEDKFLCTMEYPDEDSPHPIVFTVTSFGPALKRATIASSTTTAVHAQQRTKPEYG